MPLRRSSVRRLPSLVRRTMTGPRATSRVGTLQDRGGVMSGLSGAGVARLVVLALAVMAVPASAQTGPFQVVTQDRNATIQYRLDTFSFGGDLQDVNVQIPDQPQHLEPGELT